MSNFELYYLIIGPLGILMAGAVVFFGGRWLLRHDHQKARAARVGE